MNVREGFNVCVYIYIYIYIGFLRKIYISFFLGGEIYILVFYLFIQNDNKLYSINIMLYNEKEK